MEVIFGIAAFIVLFAVWVIIPSVVKKRHAVKVASENVTDS
jgi:hypothetical protein